MTHTRRAMPNADGLAFDPVAPRKQYDEERDERSP
jgi:hypothetical protein